MFGFIIVYQVNDFLLMVVFCKFGQICFWLLFIDVYLVVFVEVVVDTFHSRMLFADMIVEGMYCVE